MEELFIKMGISKASIKQMEEMCPYLHELTKLEILTKIDTLRQLNCDKTQIRDIISSNALFLDRSNTDIDKLIKKMQELGFANLDLLFDANPYILNLDDYEIERYVESRKVNGETLKDIVEDMETNPYLFNEI